MVGVLLAIDIVCDRLLRALDVTADDLLPAPPTPSPKSPMTRDFNGMFTPGAKTERDRERKHDVT